MSPILCQDRSKELKREKYAVTEKGGGELSCLHGWDRYGEVLRTSSAVKRSGRQKPRAVSPLGGVNCFSLVRGGYSSRITPYTRYWCPESTST